MEPPSPPKKLVTKAACGRVSSATTVYESGAHTLAMPVSKLCDGVAFDGFVFAR